MPPLTADYKYFEVFLLHCQGVDHGGPISGGCESSSCSCLVTHPATTYLLGSLMKSPVQERLTVCSTLPTPGLQSLLLPKGEKFLCPGCETAPFCSRLPAPRECRHLRYFALCSAAY